MAKSARAAKKSGQPSPRQVLRTSQDIVKMFAKRFAETPVLHSRREYYDYVSDGWQHFERLFEIGLLRWRHRIGDPAVALDEAVAFAVRMAELWTVGGRLPDDGAAQAKPHTKQGWAWEDIPKIPASIYFQFGAVALLDNMLTGSVRDQFHKILPRVSQWKQNEGRYFVRNYLDAGLTDALLNKKKPAGWDGLLANGLASIDAAELRVRTYECYMGMILACTKGKWTDVTAKIQEAQALYEARKENPDEEFTSWEGAEESNDLCVDFRLAAIMKWCLGDRPDILGNIDSPHKCYW